MLHHWWSAESQNPKLLQPQWCFPQLIKAAKSYAVSRGRGRPGNCGQCWYFIIFWLWWSGGFPGPAVPLCSSMCSSHSRGSVKLCVTSASTGYSAPSQILPHLFFHFPFSLGRLEHKDPNNCPQKFDTFQVRPKSELPGKQANKKSIFSAAHFIRFPSSSPHTLLASSSPVLFAPLPKYSNQSGTLSNKSMLRYNLSWTHPERRGSDNEDKFIGRRRRGEKEKRTEKT